MICLIESDDISRSTVLQMLRNLFPKEDITQYKKIVDFTNSMVYLKKPKDIRYLLISKSQENQKDIIDLFYKLRNLNTLCPIILTAENLTHDEIKTYIRAGVGQILIHPFNEETLSIKIKQASSFTKQIFTEFRENKTNSYFTYTFEEFIPEVHGLNLQGWITEFSELPDLNLEKDNITLFINCEDIKGINSIGVRSWLLWLKNLEKKGVNRFEFQNMKEGLLRQASMIQGFIPQTGYVNSFFLTYYNSELNIEKEFRFSFNIHYTYNSMSLPNELTAFHKGNMVKLEILPTYKKYLTFYKGTINLI